MMNQAIAIGAVATGAGVGSVTRYLTHHYVTMRLNQDFPWATLLVNVVGSFVLGFVVAVVARDAASDTVRLLVGVGFCGGLTTFSTFSYETHDLASSQKRRVSATYVVASVVTGLGAAAVGLALGA
jgi:CrcB protein